MDVPDDWLAYDCGDYFASALAETGWWDEPAQCWYIEPAERIYEDGKRQVLVIGRPGVDGIQWGYRRGHQGIWAHYPMEDEFVRIADTALGLREGYGSAAIKV